MKYFSIKRQIRTIYTVSVFEALTIALAMGVSALSYNLASGTREALGAKCVPLHFPL